MVSRSKPTPEALEAARAAAQAKRVEIGLPAIEPDDLEREKRIAEGKAWRAKRSSCCSGKRPRGT